MMDLDYITKKAILDELNDLVSKAKDQPRSEIDGRSFLIGSMKGIQDLLEKLGYYAEMAEDGSFREIRRVL